MYSRFFFSMMLLGLMLMAPSLLLTFYPIDLPPALQVTGFNWLAGQTFLYSILLFFSAVHGLQVLEARLRYETYRRLVYTAPTASLLLLGLAAYCVWRIFVTLDISTLGQVFQGPWGLPAQSLLAMLLTLPFVVLTAVVGALEVYLTFAPRYRDRWMDYFLTQKRT